MKTITLTEQQLKNIIKESISKLLIKESFQSKQLAQFFREHGGVNKNYKQYSLGDVTDDKITYWQEVNSNNEARNIIFNLKKPDNYNRRSKYDMSSIFEVYVANDGAAVVVGLDRNKIQTGIHWGGEHEKKITDRLWNNGYNDKVGDNRYVDDSDTYYYSQQSPTHDFGLHTNKNYKAKFDDDENAKQRSKPQAWENWKQNQLKHMHDYLQKYYPKTLEKIQKRNNQ